MLLLELLLAVAVLSAGIVAIFGAFASSLRAARLGGVRFEAALLTEGKVWELELLGKPGEEPPPPFQPSAGWVLGSEEAEEPEEGWRLWRVQLEWDGARRRESFVLESYLPAP